MTNEIDRPAIVTPAELLSRVEGPGPVWAQTSADLNVNLVTFDRGQGVPAHVNAEVDVLFVIVAGEGVINLNGEEHPVRAGQLCLVPKGVERAIRSSGGPLAYLTCHRRRGGLWPA
jgi:mannose-6-phosphate isomerase-like protein (cupin superfamily)